MELGLSFNKSDSMLSNNLSSSTLIKNVDSIACK